MVKANSTARIGRAANPTSSSGLATKFARPLSDPRREQRYDKLRHNDQGRYKRCRLTLALIGQQRTGQAMGMKRMASDRLMSDDLRAR